MSEAKTSGFSIHAAAVALVLVCAGPAEGGHGAVALQTCDVSCPDDSTNIYIDCDNGTVTDNRSGLVWLANADCFGPMSWTEAMSAVAGLGDIPAHACVGMEADECDCGLSDHSSPGEWRLPSMAEWRAMIVAGGDVDSCAPSIVNDVGNACWQEQCAHTAECSLYRVRPGEYWSSSRYPAGQGLVWTGHLGAGGVSLLAADQPAYV